MRIFALALLLFSGVQIFSQGCSDAGVCTADPKLFPHLAQADTSHAMAKKKTGLRSLSFETGYGVGDGNVNITNVAIKADINFKSNWALQVKLPYIFTSGKLGSANSLGDPTVLVIKTIEFEKLELSIIGGTKIASNNAGLKDKDLPLPMAYQTSLGTIDGIGLVKLTRKNFALSIGYQQPFNAANKNTFTYNAWTTTSIDSAAVYAFPETNGFKRAADLIVKLEYAFSAKKVIVSPGVLPVLHLKNDTYTLPAGGTKEISDSKGLTLNIIADLRYNFNTRCFARINGGFPVIARKVRPDGLTRHFQTNFSLTWLLF